MFLYGIKETTFKNFHKISISYYMFKNKFILEKIVIGLFDNCFEK